MVVMMTTKRLLIGLALALALSFTTNGSAAWSQETTTTTTVAPVEEIDLDDDDDDDSSGNWGLLGLLGLLGLGGLAGLKRRRPDPVVVPSLTSRLVPSIPIRTSRQRSGPISPSNTHRIQRDRPAPSWLRRAHPRYTTCSSLRC